jgi:hypothetical protein
MSYVFVLTQFKAGFRCFFGDWACSGGCKVLGQKSGLCDDDGKCWSAKILKLLKQIDSM